MAGAAIDARFTKYFQTPKSEGEAERELQSFTDNKKLISTLPCRDGYIYCYRGVWLYEQSLLGLLSAYEHFTSFPTDIFLNTYPKCGTTWIKALGFAILNRAGVKDSSNGTPHPLHSVHPQDCHVPLESVFCYPQVPDLTLTPHPRTFTTPLPYSLLPDSVKGDGGGRIVYVSRDPKDALVSLWYFFNENRAPGDNYTLESLYEELVSGVSPYGPIWDHQMEYRKESLRRPEKVLYLEYAEMKAKPEESVRKIAAFVGQPFTAEEEEAGVVEEVVRVTSFDFLKKVWADSDGVHAGLLKNSSFFRKGTVGDGKAVLTPEMADRIDQITQQKLSEFGLN